MRIKHWCTGFVVVLVCGLVVGPAWGIEFITNGDFEDTTGWVDPPVGTEYPSTVVQVPAGWKTTSVNPAAMQFTPTIDGSVSARMPLKYPYDDDPETPETQPWTGGGMYQSTEHTAPVWTLSMDFASEDPGTGNMRSISGSITSGVYDRRKKVISFRVNGDGDFQVYQYPTGDPGWYTPSGLEGCVIFDMDVEDGVPDTHHLEITGHFNLASPSYDITVIDSNSVTHTATGIQAWNYGVEGRGLGPATFDGFKSVDFSTTVPGMTNIPYCDYLLDNVSVTADERIVIPGDANDDTYVNEEDARILAENWLTTDVGWGEGDFNDDDVVDDIDATILAVNWRKYAYTSSSAVSVPEPGMIVLLLGGIFCVLMFKRSSLLYAN